MSEMSIFSIDFDMSSTENGMLHQINKELRVKTEMSKPFALLMTCFISKSSTLLHVVQHSRAPILGTRAFEHVGHIVGN